ncbi:MAG: hypothetical protein FGM33_09405 [Candidatus Kapabacteria bacterium]|nr:hypothetical protein [Candidatus Kapabacteria bacterium]
MKTRSAMQAESLFIRQICRRLAVLLPLVCLTVSHQPLQAQRQFRPLQVDVRADPFPGYYLFAPNSADSIGLMDHSGEIVIRFESGTHSNPRVDVEGKLSYFTVVSGGSSPTPAFVIRDRDLNPLDTIFPVGAVTADFHEGRVWSDTSFLLLGARYTPMDLSGLKPGGNPNATVIEGIIQEIGFDGRLLFQWSSLEHIPVDQTCDDTDLSQSLVDYIHINSVEHDTDGNFLVSCRHTDEVVKVNRLTGAVMWRLGGSASKGNQFRYLNDTTGGFFGFSHQHSAVRTSKSTLLLFDNGNLKPAPIQSRVVEYEIDELARTVRRVWAYTPSVAMFAPSMGSVKELPSGTIIVGYGSGSGVGPGKSPLVAEEIDRSGGTDMRLSIIGTRSVSAYRFNKVQFGMTGMRREVTAPTTITPVVGDSTTNVELSLSQVSRPTSLVIEKHHYRPHRIEGDIDASCVIAPYRFIYRPADTAAVGGSAYILADGLTYLDASDGYDVYWRAEEGKGAFRRAEASAYDVTTSRWKLPNVRPGEYALATSSCVVPVPRLPADSAVIDMQRPTLVFRPANNATSYDLEVSLVPSFQSTILRQRVQDTSIMVPIEFPRGSRVFWRVRRVRSERVGQWSSASSFTVRAVSPVLVHPISLLDTVGVPIADTLRWRRFQGASSYTVSITDVQSDTILLRRTIADTSLALPPVLSYSRLYEWDVSAVTDTGTTMPGRSFFGTLPEVPWIVYPEPSVKFPKGQSVSFMHRPISGADASRISVRQLGGATALDTTLIGSRAAALRLLPAGADLFVRVSGIGRYGQSESAERRISLAPTVEFPAVEHVQPLPFDKIRMGSQVTFEWQPVSGATEYHLQASVSAAFDRPVVDTVVSTRLIIATLPQKAPFLQWRVQPRSPAGIGNWSDTVRIPLVHDPLLELLPVSPPYGQRRVPTAGRFEIVPPTDAAGVRIEVSSDPYFDDSVVTFPVVSSTAQYQSLLIGRTMYWKAMKILPGGLKLFGASSILTTDEVASVGRPAAGGDVAVRFDRASMTISCMGFPSEVESMAVYDIHGRSLHASRIDGSAQWLLVAPSETAAQVATAVVWLCAEPVPRFVGFVLR